MCTSILRIALYQYSKTVSKVPHVSEIVNLKGALCEGGDILKMKESAFSKVNLATKNEKNTTWVYLTGLLERIIFGIETLPVC